MKDDPNEHEKARKRHKGNLEAIKKALLAPSVSPQTLRSQVIAAARSLHLIQAMVTSFNAASQAHSARSRAFIHPKWSLTQALDYRYNATLLSLAFLLHDKRISPDRWFASQFATLGPKVKILTPYVCYGTNAWARYQDWEARQAKRFLRSSESKACVSLDIVIQQSISRSHKQALSWQKALKEVQPPNLSAALLYIWPQAVSSWYLLSYPDVRETLVVSGLVDDARLLSCYQKLRRSPRLLRLCTTTLQDCIERYGELEFT